MPPNGTEVLGALSRLEKLNQLSMMPQMPTVLMLERLPGSTTVETLTPDSMDVPQHDGDS
jgi:hypothetical protein